MKKFAFLLLTLLLFHVSRSQSYVNIPDENFAAFLNETIPAAMNGNQMDTSSITLKTIKSLNVWYKGKPILDLSGIQYLTSLEDLICTVNTLTNLPALPASLISLDCHGNFNLKKLPVLPPKLKKLVCWNSSLSNLPELPGSLEFLNCQWNNLTDLPVLPKTLKTLYCDYNQLTSIPELPNTLIDFVCRVNQITSLPTLPPKLTRLWCFDNQLSSLPELPVTLTDLACCINQLTKLPALPDKLTLLDCSSNKLTSIPKLPEVLTKLNCSNNQMSSLPDLPNTVTELICGSNQLTHLPALPSNLEYLSCGNNQLTSLPELPYYLDYLNCESNRLTSLPSMPGSGFSLSNLNCSNNLIICFPTFPNSIRYSSKFNISNNPFTCLPNYIPAMDAATLAFPLCVTGDSINNKYGCSAFNGIVGSAYKDLDADCEKDTTDLNLLNVHIKLYDVNGVLINQTYTALNGIYSFPNLIGTYTVELDTLNMPFLTPCSNQQIDTTVTLSSLDPVADGINFSFGCKPGFDLGVMSVVTFGIVFPGEKHYLRINAGDMSSWYNLNCADGIKGKVEVAISGPVSYREPIGGGLRPSMTGDVFTYSIPNFGMTDFGSSFGLVLGVDETAKSGDKIYVQVKITPTDGDNNVSNNIFNYCYLVSNSMDPNMKEVTPENVLPGYQDDFIYTIHFQNTGDANAINIRLVDELNSNLDLSTFRILNYSHLNTVSFDKNILTVRFPNIQLPDSASNPEGSNGFFQYSIKPKANLPAGTKITNKASIYFDYNEPVQTNTTTNLFTTTATVNKVLAVGSVSVYPNPAGHLITIESITPSPQNYLVSIVNVQGQEVLCENIRFAGKHTIDVTHLENGIYFLSVRSGKENSTNKLIIEK